jgi:hypothetical protein
MVFYAKSDERYSKDGEGTRLPNAGISTTNSPYGTLYNISKNASSIWRTHIPRIREQAILKWDEETKTWIPEGRKFAERVIGPYVRLRFKIKNNGEERYVIDDLIINNNTTWH